MVLTNENYYSLEANKEYMSASQFKDFQKCQYEALLKVNGELIEEPSKSMLQGSYVDAYFTDDFDLFVEQNHDKIYNSKGALYKEFEIAENCIHAIDNDELFKQFISGKHQVIMVGVIGGVKFKIKIDSLLENAIVDLKVMASIYDRVWVEIDGRNVKVDFVEAFGYDIIGAIYQEVVRQNIGRKLPFILAVVTKEEEPDKALIQIDQEYLDSALKLVEENAEHYDLIKQGLILPTHCEHCPSCRKAKKVMGVISYKELYQKESEVE